MAEKKKAAAGKSKTPKSGASDRASKPAKAAGKAGATKAKAPAARKKPAAAKTEKVVRSKAVKTPQASRVSSSPGSGSVDREPPGETRGKYVYCIVRSSEPLSFGPIGIGAEPSEVHTVHHRSLAAVVSDTPIEIYDPTRENVLAHERVNETVMREHTVIPMSFGTVFKTAGDIVELLKSAYDAFDDVLTKMKDKLEFGLKVLWERDLVIRAIEEEDEDVRRLKEEISHQKGSTYFARMQYGRLIDAALDARSRQFVADIFTHLRDVSVASRANKPIGDKMLMNAAFLVSRDKEAAFDKRVKELGQRYDSLIFKYTGPWPPYNFVNIRLKLERAQGES